MPERISKAQRWLDLIALLLNRKIPLRVEEIMERVPAYAQSWAAGDETARASVRRMFERDKDELRRMGIPIESVQYDINFGGEILEGYRILRGDFYLPYLKVLGGGAEASPSQTAESIDLEAEEARTALDALRAVADVPAFPFVAEARSALSKLTFDIDSERYAGAPTIQVERPGTREVLERTRILTDAILARKRVRFRYHGIRRGATSDREVEPYGLFLQRDWYLIAHDPAREGLRLFRVSRIESPVMNTLTPKEPDFQVPAEFDLRAFVGRRAWELSDDRPMTVEVRFRFPSSLLVSRNGEGEMIREEPDGSSIRRFEVTDPDPFLRWLLGFAGEAAIVNPPGLRDALWEMARAAASLYGEGDG